MAPGRMRSGNQLLVVAILRLYVPLVYLLLRNTGLSLSFLDMDTLGSSKPHRQSLPPRQDLATTSVLSDHKTVGTAEDIETLSRQELNKNRYISNGFIDEYNIRELLHISQYLTHARPISRRKNSLKPDSVSRNNFKPKRTLRGTARVMGRKKKRPTI